jgi:hypothetical protein
VAIIIEIEVIPAIFPKTISALFVRTVLSTCLIDFLYNLLSAFMDGNFFIIQIFSKRQHFIWYAHFILQFSHSLFFYTGFSSDLGQLYQSEEVLVDVADIQDVLQGSNGLD